MLLFRKKTILDKQAEANNTLDTTARAIATVIINRQIQLAKCCSSRYERLSTRTKMAVLLLFCFLFGGSSLWFLAKGVWPEDKQQTVSTYSGSLSLTEPVLRDSIHFRNNHPLKK